MIYTTVSIDQSPSAYRAALERSQRGNQRDPALIIEEIEDEAIHSFFTESMPGETLRSFVKRFIDARLAD